MRPILRKSGTIRAVPRKACIMCRLRIVLKRIVTVHEMILVQLFVLSALLPLQDQFQIAPRFPLDDARRVARVIEYKPRCDRHLTLCIAAEVLHMLVDAPDEANVRRMAKDTLHIGGCPEKGPRIHVDIDEMDNKAIELLSYAVFLDQGAHARRTLLRKVLIRIRKDNPIPRSLVECEILRRRKIVDPVKMIDLGTARPRDLRRRILRAGIDHDHLIGKDTHRGEPARQIFRLILCNDTCRNLHRISSISSLAFRWAGSSASNRARAPSASVRPPRCSAASAVP